MCLPRNLFLATGLFDEDFVNGFEDVEFCARLCQRGFRQTINPASRIVHHESVSQGEHARDGSNGDLYFKKGAPILQPDFAQLLKADGLEPHLTPWLNFVPAMPEARETELASSVREDRQLLRALIDNPYWLEGWQRLPNWREIAPIIFTLFMDPELGLETGRGALARGNIPYCRQLLGQLSAWAKPLHVMFAQAIFMQRQVTKGGWAWQTLANWQKEFPRIKENRLVPFLRGYLQLAQAAGLTLDPKDQAVYQNWRAALDLPLRKKIVGQFMGGAPHSGAPCFSILMPVYDPDPRHLTAALDSVRDQNWPHWELCIADDASTNPEIRAILQSYARLDDRIRVIWRQENGHIAKATNSALELARFDWVALLDQDDLLEPDSLAFMSRAILENPQGMLFYSDEDRLVEDNFCTPYFKSNWDPILLLAQNYISHLAVLNRQRLMAIGGLRDGFPAAQDHDLFLRFSDGLPAGAIVHVPHVLYHWRAHEKSTAKNLDQKPEATTSRLRAVQDWCDRHSPGSRLTPFHNLYCIVHFPMPRDVKLTLICPGSPTAAWLEKWRHCLPSAAEIISLTDQREKPTAQFLNQAVENSEADVIGFVSPWVQPLKHDSVGELLGALAQAGIGAVGGCVVEERSQALPNAGFLQDGSGAVAPVLAGAPALRSLWYAWNALTRSVDAADGGCLFTSRNSFVAAGGLRQEMGGWMFQDYCLRLGELGLRTLWVAPAQFSSSRTIRANMPGEFAVAWHDRVRAFNPNLLCGKPVFSLNTNLE